MKAEKAKAQAKGIEAPVDKVVPNEVVDTDSSALHEIEMPYGEIKLELDFTS